jgi:hypothetical protein
MSKGRVVTTVTRRVVIWAWCQESKDRVVASSVARHIGARVWWKMSKGLLTSLDGCGG